MTDTILWMGDVEKLTHLTWPTIHKYIREKNFPPPSKIGNKKAWYKSDVTNWLDKQMEQGKDNDNTE